MRFINQAKSIFFTEEQNHTGRKKSNRIFLFILPLKLLKFELK